MLFGKIALSLIYFGYVGAVYGMEFCLPQTVKAFGLSNAHTDLAALDPRDHCAER
jgi:MFS transporter, ACS family, tartrate transporter